MKTLSFLVKPVSYHCNLNCTYCFYKRVCQVYPDDLRTMSIHTAQTLIQSAVDTRADYISFCWQGGEPTLAGLDFFKEIVDIQNKYKKDYQVIENSVQTNGILLNDSWCAFFSRNGILVGISLDGDREIHDSYRLDKDGKGTFDNVMNSIQLMKEYNVQYNILTLLTNKNIKKAKEVYAFFRHNNFSYVQFIPCFEHDEKGNSTPWSVNGNDCGTFYCELFSEWIRDGFPYVSIRLFQDVLMYSHQNVKNSCCWLETCNVYVVVEHNGDCYPCDFYVYPEWKLGNINDNVLHEIMDSPLRNQFALLKRKRADKCSDCSIRNFCMGDCIRFRHHNGDRGEGLSEYCHAWRMLWNHYEQYKGELGHRLSNLQKAVETGLFYQAERNESCPCGSLKKFKKCCGKAPLAI